jgi:ABC-type multidrug transport system permease subunit
MINDPSLLFLDEPTSGLDSFTAYNIMETLINLAKNDGRTIICTIHQPRSNIFSLFDMLLLLSEGQVVYFGPASNAISYFSKLNFVCPNFANPADYLLDISSIDSRTEENNEFTKKQVEMLINHYSTSKEYNESMEFIENLSKITMNNQEIFKKSGFATGIWEQNKLLFNRSVKNFYRDKAVQFIKLFQNIFFALVIGLIYFHINHNQTGITDRTGAIFFILINSAFSNMFAVITTFPTEKTVFMRERASRMYRLFPYYLTRSIAELPSQIFLPILFGSIVYWMVGFQPTFQKFILFIIILLLSSLCSVSVGLAISTASPTLEFATVIAPIIMVIFLLFGGFYITSQTIPPYFTWIQWLSFVKYGFAALMQNEFTGLVLTCTKEQETNVNGSMICPITSGEQVLTLYGLTGNDTLPFGYNILMMGVIIIVLRIFGYLSLRISTRKL